MLYVGYDIENNNDLIEIIKKHNKRIDELLIDCVYEDFEAVLREDYINDIKKLKIHIQDTL